MADLTPKQQATLESWRATISGVEEPQEDGFCVGDPENASHFYKFSNGAAYNQSCPSGLIFNPTLQVCDHPGEVSVDENPAPR